MHLCHLYGDGICITIAPRCNCVCASDCETETIYSSQSRDTVSAQDEDEEEEDDEFDDVAEYEPESCAEAERPPQVPAPAHGDTLCMSRLRKNNMKG